MAELLARAVALESRTLADIAGDLGISVPTDPRRSKGWAGQLLEVALGAESGSLAEPDFPHLGVEMKTVPVDARGRPRESTYVCTAPVDGSAGSDWSTSWVRRKLACVLWVALSADASTPGDRRVVGTLLWTPTPAEEQALQADWEMFAEAMALGDLWQMDARRGVVLQLRPKAANAGEWAWAVDAEGEWVRRNPLGFYLRPAFTRALLAPRLAPPG